MRRERQVARYGPPRRCSSSQAHDMCKRDFRTPGTTDASMLFIIIVKIFANIHFSNLSIEKTKVIKQLFFIKSQLVLREDVLIRMLLLKIN